jgi:uncharacterized protein (TIGR02147 family)
MLLQGKRPIKIQHAVMFSQHLHHNQQEKLFLQGLIELDQADSFEKKNLVQHWLNQLRPTEHAFKNEIQIREIEEYKLISHWLHTAILSLTQTKNFESTLQSIHRAFKSKVTLAETQQALDRLIALGLLKINTEGHLVSTSAQIRSKEDVSNEGIQEHHRLVSELASSAIQSQSILEREFQSFCIAIHPEQLETVKTMIREFRKQLVTTLCQDPRKPSATQVYQCNLQFFRLTESPQESSTHKTTARTKASNLNTHSSQWEN